MDPERWRRVEDLFHRAAGLDGGERTELLGRQCRGDPQLRAAVERLLADDGRRGDLFDRVEDAPRTLPPDPNAGRVLGAYRLTERLAEGGMGLVYRGQRCDGLFEQDVAVKLIRSECATERTLRRFEFERSTLAALNHPNIARLYDGGTSEEGFPYFVMEYIAGEHIDAYCDRHGLSIAKRLRLFATVCRAVHFAHRNLIIHCDLKPGNVLIDACGVPKLLDFGIARLVDHHPGDGGPRPTETRILTPEYASPEQLKGCQATTAVDVYALGVILYGLLTGVHPFSCDSSSSLEWHRTVLEEVPARPSTAVARAAAEQVRGRAAARCGIAPAQLSRRLRGDLDRIVLMALRKEPERRYASAQELADDIERHLAGQPVQACEDSLSYRASKFVRRHRVAVAAAAAVLLGLLFGLVAARRGGWAARLQAEHARIEADSSHDIADFLMDTLLASVPSWDETRGEEQLRRIELHAGRVRRQYPDQPHLRANLLDALGDICVRLGLLAEAEPLLREALEIRQATFGPRTLEVALSEQNLGRLEFARGHPEEAVAHLQRALELHRACPIGTHTDVAGVANDLAAALRNAGRIEEAWELHEEALALRRASGPETLPVAESLNNMAGIQLQRGEFSAAAESLSRALEIRRAVLGPQHALTLQTQSNLATAAWCSGEHDEACRLLGEAVEGLRRLGPEAGGDLEQALENLSQQQLATGEFERAWSLLEEALERRSRRLGPEHPEVTTTRQKLAVLLHARGDDEQAAAQWEQVIAQRREVRASPVLMGRSLYEYGVFLVDTGRLEDAQGALEEAVEVLGPLASENPAPLGRAEAVLGVCLMRAGRTAEARRWLGGGLEHLERSGTVAEDELASLRRNLREVGGGGG